MKPEKSTESEISILYFVQEKPRDPLAVTES